jgi:hypothetical protein
MAKVEQPEKLSTLKKIRLLFRFIRERDRLFIRLLILAAVVPLVLTGVALALGIGWLWAPVGVMLTLLAMMIVISVRGEKARVVEAEQQPGGAAWYVQNMRGDWRVTPAISATTDEDMVHLVVGRPGVVLLAEGNPQRVRGLIGQEKRRLAKVIGNADMRDFVVGHGEGQVPMAKLRITLMRLPRTTTGKDVNALDKRLKALTARPQIPKGAIPKNMRPAKGAFRATRGR